MIDFTNPEDFLACWWWLLDSPWRGLFVFISGDVLNWGIYFYWRRSMDALEGWKWLVLVKVGTSVPVQELTLAILIIVRVSVLWPEMVRSTGVSIGSSEWQGEENLKMWFWIIRWLSSAGSCPGTLQTNQ